MSIARNLGVASLALVASTLAACGGTDGARARRNREDPLVFLEDESLFGGLHNDPTFTSLYAAAIRSLHTHGARATLERWAAQSATREGES